jgi:hypothetical protein
MNQTLPKQPRRKGVALLQKIFVRKPVHSISCSNQPHLVQHRSSQCC